jgi:UDP-glucose 4-epimerase
MKTVLITGVAGFLGSHLADEFLDKGDRVIGIDNLIGGYIENIPAGVEFYAKDLNDLDDIAPLFSNVDLVIHCACTAYEGLSVFSPSLVVRNTTQITVNVMSAAIKFGVKRLIHMSSMARYGTQETVPFIESMTPKPQDPYGIAKFSAEQLVENLAGIHGIEYVILVPHNIIGPRQKFDDPYRNVASIMTNRMLQGKQPIIYGNGEQKRCFSFIQDVIRPILTACDSNVAVGRVINIGPDEEFVSINQLAIEIAQILNFDLNPIYMPGRPQEVFHANCSANLAREILDYKTSVSLDAGLRELVSWIQSQPRREFSYHLPLELVTEKTPKTWVDKLI